MMVEALIAGAPVARAQAVAAAGRLLDASANPLIVAGMMDCGAAEAALDLARAARASFDHENAAAALAELDVMRQAGWLVATPLEARALADCVLLVGSGVADFPSTPPPLAPARGRKVMRLAGDDLMARLGLLRALIGGRAIAADPALAALAAALRAAHFAVIHWSAEEIPPLAIEMLCGMIEDLNETTRCFGLPQPGANNVAGVTQACAWKTGLPPRVTFAPDQARHDPWRLDAARMVAGGEADVALWIGAELPSWAGRVRLISLVPATAALAPMPEIVIFTGRPGIDHHAILHDPALGALAFKRAATPSAEIPPAAASLAAITAALAGEMVSC